MSLQEENFTFRKKYSPAHLGRLAAVGYLAVSLLSIAFDWLKGGISPIFYWLIGASFLFVFILFVCLLYIGVKDNLRYWKEAVIVFSGLFVGTIVGSRLFSGIPIDEAETFRWIYIVLIVSFFILIGIMSVVKYLINMAEMDDNSQPKK